MPTLDDLNDIKHKLLSIGDEPEILASKGEVPVDIGPPETGLSDDINALFDDFADVDEDFNRVPESDEVTAEVGGLGDFDFDLEDEEPVFDMDGFDAPEDAVLDMPEIDEESLEQLPDDSIKDDLTPSAPDDLVPEFVEEIEGEPSEGVDELPDDLSDSTEDLDFDEDLASDLGFDDESTDGLTDSDDLISELVEGEDDLGFAEELGLSDDDLDFGEGDSGSVPDDLGSELVEGEDDLGFAEELGLSDEDLDFEEEDLGSVPDDLSFDDEGNDEPAVSELAEEGFAEELDLSEEEDFDFGEEELGSIPEGDLAEELDLSVEEDLDFSKEEFGSIPEDSASSVPELVDGEERLDFDLSGGDPGFDDIDNSDDFGLPGDDLVSGDDEELSFDDSKADDLDLGEFEISDESFDEELEIDEFDLGDLGQDFGVLEEDLSVVHEETIAPTDSSGVDSDLEEEKFEIDEETFDRVKASLLILPRNLKLIIEEEIGEKDLKGPSLKKLIDALAEGKTPKEIASITSKITGKKIKIPANYARRTGLDFEEEKDSFQYALIHNILPLVKIFAISTIIIAVLSFVSYKFIYRPVHAHILYNRGYEQLENGNYDSSSNLFDQAFDKYKIKKQFYRYAEGYIDADQWSFARSQYEKLLDNYLFDKKGTIDYATMEFEKLADYEHSTELLNNFLESDKNKRDYDALLLLGDIYLEWGWEDYDRYDDARLAYAKIMSDSGYAENKILFRMLRFFIRTDNAKEVEILKERFQADPELEIDPDAYAELAGFQIDRKDISDVQELLFRAKEVENGIPEIHYQLARLFSITGEGDEEDKALRKTLENLANNHPLTRRNREVNIDTLRRQGERFYEKEEYLQAEEVYLAGITLLEQSRERNIIKGEAKDYGRLYADLGHIYYYISENPEIALDQYEKAEGEGFYSPEIYYNKGYIRYRNENFKQALLEFYNSAGSFSVNSNLLYATANTLFQRNDYFAAQGYYNHLLDILEQKLSRVFSIRLEDRTDHRMMVEDLMKAYNNMGVTMYGLFERTGDPSKFTAAMVSFTQSTGYFDDLTRNQTTMERTEAINLASLNQRKMLYPIPDYELQIFTGLPKHLAPQ